MKFKKSIAILLSMLMIFSSSVVFGADAEIDVSDSEKVIELYNALLNVTVKRYGFDITKEQLLQSAVEQLLTEHPEMFDELAKGAYEALDENSYYLTADEYAKRVENVSKQFEGIGVSLSLLNNKAIITKVHKNTPAIVKGLKEGDIITAVNGEDITNYNLEKIVSLVRGELGTFVDLNINRDGVPMLFTIPRAIVSIQTVEYENLGQNNSGYIKIDSFSTNTINEFDEAVTDLRSQGVDKVILDLRNNPGGYLVAGVVVASEFVPEGKLIVTEDHKDDSKNKEYISDGKHERMKVVVLVNEYSASASEIVTGAIKEYKLGPVVGTTTFGKGTVQTSSGIKNGGAIWLTIAQYNLPNGDNIHGVGIAPDYEVKNTTKSVDLSKFIPLSQQKVLSYGDRSDDVLSLKQHLSAIGFTFLNMDDLFDDSLVSAITAFQQATDLFPYGVADFTTQAKIIEKANEALEVVDNQLTKAKELIYKMK